MYKVKKSLTFLLILLLMLQPSLVPSILPSAQAAETSGGFSLGPIIEEWSRDITPGFQETRMRIDSTAGKQELFVMELDATKEDIHIQSAHAYSEGLGSLRTVREQAASRSKPGNVVIGAVNADFYNTATGIPTGPVIQEGKILKPSKTEAFAVDSDGRGMIGYPNPSFTAVLPDKELTINGMNQPREQNALVVYTPSYKNTKTNEQGTEVILSSAEGDMQKPGIVTAVIDEIRVNEGNSSIKEGKLVLSASGQAANELLDLQKGDTIRIKTAVASGWEDVQDAVGGKHILAKAGSKTALPTDSFTTARAPRTAVGIKADGDIFFLVADGRQPAYAEGLTVFELQDLMLELGAVDALNLDGGGSSTFAARTNGEGGLHTVNIPSDGQERKVANSLLVTSSAVPGPLSQLAVQPDHLLMLAGSTYDFKAKGMDASHHPVLMKDQPSWSVNDESLSINNNGKLTAGSESTEAKVSASLNGKVGHSAVSVTTELTELTLPQDQITLKRGEELQLEAAALWKGKKVHASPDALSWEVSGNIGTIDQNGVFKAVQDSASGSITVRHRDLSYTMQVQIGKLPVILEDFENGIDDWEATGARYQAISIRQSTYPEPVRFGQHALELTYDFTGTIGTSGAYAHPKEDIILEDYPEAIGMWIYGDGNGHWLRAQMRDGGNNAFPIDFTTAVDWEGWKYVEAPVPKGKATPLKLDMPVRLMETSNDNKDAGTIFADNIRAVYGETNDDLINPIIGSESPSADEVTATNQLKISAIATDAETGIAAERIQMQVDGQNVNHQYDEVSGEISYIPEAPLLDGFHQVKVAVHDRFGNETSKVWDFEVAAGDTGIYPSYGEKAYIGGEYNIPLHVVKPENIDEITIHSQFDNHILKPAKDKIILDKRIPESHVVRNEILADGQVHLVLKNIHTIKEIHLVDTIGSIPFSVPPSALEPAGIRFSDSKLKLKGQETDISLYLPGRTVELDAHLQLSVDRASHGFRSKLKVMDEKGKPVKGAVITMENPSIELGRTNSKGELTTSKLTENIGTFVIQAKRGDRYSFKQSVQVLDHLGTEKPESLTVTFADSPAKMNVSWTTNPLTTDSVVQYTETKAYKKDGFNKRNSRTVKGDSRHHSFDAGEIQTHTAVLKGLKQGTAYTYRVGDGSKDGWSEAASFNTESKKDTDFSFLVMGDTQSPPLQNDSGFGIFSELFTRAKQEDPDAAFMLHVGDMIDDGNLYSHWNAFLQSVNNPAQLASTPFVPAVGNHENIGNGTETFKRLFTLPDNGPKNFKGTVYSFDYGDAHFAVLNTETTKEGLQEQAEWLKKDMKRSKKKWKIVTYHRSPYASNPAGGSEMVKEAWPKVFDEIGIDLAISGHDHSYVRTFPLKDGSKHPNGTTYMIAGSTGQKFYNTTPQDYMELYFDEKTQVYTNVSITSKSIQITAKTRDGRIVDQHTITKNK